MTPLPQRSFALFTQCAGTEFNNHEVYGDDKLISYGLRTVCIVSYFQIKTLKQNDENSHICVCHYVASQLTLSARSNFMNVYARSFDWIYFTVQLKRTLES